MPRPKVHPNNRQRAAEACSLCRASKKRCSAVFPCTACSRRGTADSCDLSRARSAAQLGCTPQRRAAGKHGDGSTPPKTAFSGIDLASIGITLHPRSSHDASSAQGDKLSSKDQTSCGTESRPRMLLNQCGNRMFIGEASSLSFLQLVRDNVSANIGPSQFSHNEESESMLETQPLSCSARYPSPDFFSDETMSYFDAYCSSTAGLIDILSASESSYLCRTDGEVRHGILSINSTIRDLVVAIGAQCQSITSAQNTGETYFRRAQLAAFSTMLEDPSIDMVRVFLLMTFFMLGRCRRNTAFMYLGIATRAAISIGLHGNGSYAGTCTPEEYSRTQVWMSLCNVDILVSSILGRPPATNGLHLDAGRHTKDSFESTALESTSMRASFQILVIINDIVNRIYTDKETSLSTAEVLLGRVEEWSRILPKSLSSQRSFLGNPSQKASIAEMHVSCLYYFAITLITRPILVSSLTSGTGSERSQLSLACLDAAVLLAQTCMNALDKSFMIGNMCFIKPLVFAAGLILGFAMFMEQKVEGEIEAAFQGAQQVLSFLSTQSPQAAHYLDILTLLSGAIARKRQKQSLRGRTKYVEKLFAQDQATTTTIPQDGDNTLVSPISVSEAMTADNGFPFLRRETFASMMNDAAFDIPLNWDTLEIAQWDSFPFSEQRNF